jgi:hypothetical protein
MIDLFSRRGTLFIRLIIVDRIYGIELALMYLDLMKSEDEILFWMKCSSKWKQWHQKA